MRPAEWPVRPLRRTPTVQEALVAVGRGAERQVVRLIAISRRGCWDRYLTNELDPERLPAEPVVALYAHRGELRRPSRSSSGCSALAYFGVGSDHGVQLQLGATWLLDAVLVDLTDAVADALKRPVADLSLEMTYRGIPFFTRAFHQGTATDPVAYVATHAQLFGLLKRKRRPKSTLAPPLDLPGPDLKLSLMVSDETFGVRVSRKRSASSNCRSTSWGT